MIEGLPGDAAAYKRTAIFDEASLPPGLRRRHSTREEVWGVITVLAGRLAYRILEPASATLLTPGRPGLVRPRQYHQVEPDGPVRFFVEFYRRPSMPGSEDRHG